MNNDKLYPFIWKGNVYEKDDCDYRFILAYFKKDAMREDCAVYFDSDVWIYPNGTFIDEEFERNYEFILKHQTENVKSLDIDELIDKTLTRFIELEKYEMCEELKNIKSNRLKSKIID